MPAARVWIASTVMILAFLVTVGPALALTQVDLEPVYDDPRVAVALARLQAGDAAGAREALLAIGTDGQPAAVKDRLRFLLGLACVRSGDWLGAMTVLDGLEKAIPLVEDRILLLRGEALTGLRRHVEAADTLARVPRSSAVGPRALRARAESLSAAAMHEDAASAWRDVVSGGQKDPEAIGSLAAALVAAGRREEAVTVLRQAYFESPGPGRPAFRRALEDLGVRLEATAAEALRHARALLDAQASEKAAAEAARLASSGDPATRCEALTIRGAALAKLRRHAEAAEVWRRVVAECEGRTDMARALFNGARSAWRCGDRETGDLLAGRLAREHRASTLNDDLAVTRGRSAMSRGDVARATAILEESLGHWPDGDMANESRWVLAWVAIRSHDRDKAVARLRAGLEAARGDAAYGSRFSYWLGRLHADAGRREEAVAEWERCARSYPMTFYGHLALRRLAAARGVGLATTLKEVDANPATPGQALSCATAVVPDGPLARAVWLAQTGLPDLASEEVAAATNGNGDGAWLAAMILDAGRQYTRSHRLATRLLAEKRSWPDAGSAPCWRLAYPRPWEEAVGAASRESGVDRALIYAVMREESAFVAGIESRANAIGLMQLILPTARAVAARLGLTATPETLRVPEVNIRLGAGFLAELLREFAEPILAIPGYNAGGGAIRRWLRENPGVPADEFVESIGAEETRDYARKVFESYAAYRMLYAEGNERFAPLRFVLPTARPAGGKTVTGKPAAVRKPPKATRPAGGKKPGSRPVNRKGATRRR